jgi:RND family efflux transporter MFP subunit
MRNHTLFIAGVLLVLGFAGLQSCGQNKDAGDPMARLSALKEERAKLESEIASLEKELEASGVIEKKLRTVALTEIAPADFRHFIDLQGKVEAEESVMATAQMPGTLRAVHVRNGDVVKKGDLLAELDDAVIQRSMAELEGQLVVARDLYERQKGLWEQKVGSEVQYIQAKNAVESLERSLATVKENWNMTKIKAPTSGTVDYVQLKAGQAIAPGVPLCAVVNLSKLKVVGAVTEAHVTKIRKGDKVQLYFPDTGKELTSTISFVSKLIMPNTRTFAVECALPSGDYTSNQIVVMKIIDYSAPDAIIVPVNVIQTEGDGDFVLIAEKADAEHAVVRRAPVTKGRVYSGQVEVLSGLKPGDMLITTGFQDVNPGESVHY